MKIHSEEENELALKEIEKLMDIVDSHATETSARFDDLVDAVERFEACHYYIGKRTWIGRLLDWINWTFRL